MVKNRGCTDAVNIPQNGMDFCGFQDILSFKDSACENPDNNQHKGKLNKAESP